jgi:pyruvate dehydrogenase E1 component
LTADDWLEEQQEWLDAMDDVLANHGSDGAGELLTKIQSHLSHRGVTFTDAALNTHYKNTIDVREQPAYPGDIDLEIRIGNIIRWNAVAMVLQAYDSGSGVGGHIATYLSAATMMEVGFNHVFRASSENYGGDHVHFQAHTAPGIYARAYLEGRLSVEQLGNFRRELAAGGGLPSYPHPRRLPWFWEMPTASMGLSTPSAIYQARFAKYLESRDLKPRNGGKIWAFVGDGEADEPEVLGTINIASREALDNLVLVVNCNLQRLDGPVRGNGKIIQELERAFRGADWHVIKVIWGGGWDAILARDEHGILQERMEQAVDGDYQMYTVSSGDVVREHWVENTPELKELMKTLTDEEIRSIKRGGQDHKKIYAAFRQAADFRDKPCVVLLKTVKGEGLGHGTEGSNTVHQKKQLKAEERLELAKRLDIPLSEEEIVRASFYRPAAESAEIEYLLSHRQALGGFIPSREVICDRLEAPPLEMFADMLKGSQREVSTTMVVVRMLSRLLRDEKLGKYIVPIVPDEARTFGMDGLFPQAGIYSPAGQRYQPVDANTIAPYREAEDGQIMQEGICETGAMASFLAAGTAYANHGLPMIPFYIFYSMFGFQRVGDMIWACGDMMCKGFLLGGTSGRTTLNGEGLQHQDGHSHLVANTIPNLISYDPAFAFEIAVIVREGIKRMYELKEDVFYYLTVTNQNYAMPPMPEGVEEGVLVGMYCFERVENATVNLFGSGAIMTEVIAARELLAEQGVMSNLWSVTSYNELARQALECERRRLLSVGADDEVPLKVESLLKAEEGVFVAASDYMKALPLGISKWIPGPYVVLGTDGFGLSEGRHELRQHFEVSAAWIAFASLSLLAQNNFISHKAATAFAAEQNLDLAKAAPFVS